jgi:hypothetical protein
MVSYQIFAQNAIDTVVKAFNGVNPDVASVLSSGSGVVVFICSFAWMFVLSATVSSLMFGRERRRSVQFLVSLALTLTGTGLLYLLQSVLFVNLADPNVVSKPFLAVFNNALFSFFYLALPFIFMIAMDLHAAAKHRQTS